MLTGEQLGLEKRKRKITFDSRRDNFLLKNVKTRHKFIYDEEANIIRENRALPVYEYTWIGTSLEGSNFPKVLLLGPTLIHPIFEAEMVNSEKKKKSLFLLF